MLFDSVTGFVKWFEKASFFASACVLPPRKEALELNCVVRMRSVVIILHVKDL